MARTQWAVGNGFFHSGSVSTPEGVVQYAYDCGALRWKKNQSALHREIREYVGRVDRVDLVFVSHFDFDHVSGIPALASLKAIDRFIIPMIPAPERLFGLARQLSDGTVVADDSEQWRFYASLIQDPAATLAGIAGGGDRVVQVALGDAVDNEAAILADVAVEPPELIAPAETVSAETAPLSIAYSDQSVSVDCGGEVVWEWRYGISREANSVIDSFVQRLVDRGAIHRRSDLQSPRTIANLVLCGYDDLKVCYEAAIKEVARSFTRNMTSLMVYSGPPATARFRAYRSRSASIERAEIGAWNPRPGWLGLGDADLRSARRVDHVNLVFRRQKPAVGTFAPAHHGSRYDWSDRLLQGFGAGGDYSPTFVFSASPAYGHPHREVLVAINEVGGTAVVAGLAARSRWTEALTVFVDA